MVLATENNLDLNPTGYGFSLVQNVEGWGLQNVPVLQFGFVGFVALMEGYSRRWFSKKGAWNHPLWLPCQFSVCPEKNKIRCLNSLAMPTRLFGLDFDDAGNTITGVKSVLDALGCDYYLHTSMSYKPGQAEKCRAVIHTSELLMDDADNKLLFAALRRLFSKHGLTLDDACKNIARKFYVPGSNQEYGVECWSHFELERGPLDIAGMMQAERDRAKRAVAMQNIQQSFRTKRAGEYAVSNEQAEPYFQDMFHYNIANPERVTSFMALTSRGSAMASMAAHIVGYCKQRFGPYVVPSDMMEQALREWAGKTSHDQFANNIADARKHCDG